MTKDNDIPVFDGLAQVFDAYPAPTFVVDENVHILLANRAARVRLGHEPNPTPVLMKLGGEALCCVDSVPGGCGQQKACQECVLRSSVRQAFTSGAVHRAMSSMRLRGEHGEVHVSALVSASPFTHGGTTHAVLTLEDLSDVPFNEAYVRTEQALLTAHDRAATMARFPEKNPDPVLQLRRDLTLAYANEAARTGLKAVGLEMGCAVPPPLAAPARRALAQDQAIRTEVSFGDRVFSLSFCPTGRELNVYGQDVTDRRRAEEALRDSESRYQLPFENMLDGFAYCRMLVDERGYADDFVYLHVNSAFETLTGLRDVVGRRVTEVIPGIRESHPELIEIYGRVARTGTSERFEIEFRPLRRWLSISVYSPHADHFVAVFDDVTERRRVVEQLTQEKERLRVTLSSIGDAVIATDDAARITLINGVAEQLTSWTCEDAVGKPLDEVLRLVNEETRQPVSNPVDRVLRDGVVVGLANHTALVARDGTERPIADSAAPIRDANGRIAGVVLVFRDQTQERRVERFVRLRLALLEYAAAHSLEEVLRETLDQIGSLTGSPIGFYHFVESDQRTLSLQAWSTETTRKFCRAQGRGLHYPIDQAGVWVDCVRQRRPVVHNDYAALPHRKGLPEGHAAVIRELVVPVLREKGVVAILGVGNKPSNYTEDDMETVSYLADVTWEIASRKRAEEALRDSDQHKSEFLAVLSHELRNPLTPIRNSLSVMDRAAPGSEQATRAREIIRRQTEHLAHLVDDLLDVTRISRGKIELERVRVDLREIVCRTCDDHRTLFDRRGIELRVDSSSPVWTDADETRLAQIIGNLLQNAAKYSHEGGTVTTRVGIAGGQCEIVVHDDGVGIDRELLPRVFEPFVQVDSGIARTSGGLGLGLALVKSLVEMHGGSVRARSEGPGRGSEFVVTLPLESAPQHSVPAPSTSTVTGPIDILIIEDNVDAAQSIAELLEMEGHRTAVATDGASGITKAREMKPDVILCDLGLPDIDGYDIARTLRRDADLGSTRLVALSGYAQAEDRRRAADAGFDAHLAKPPSFDALMASLLGERR